MKKKATTRKVVVKNRPFLAAIEGSFSESSSRHKKIAGLVKDSGILTTLTAANKKASR